MLVVYLRYHIHMHIIELKKMTNSFLLVQLYIEITLNFIKSFIILLNSVRP